MSAEGFVDADKEGLTIHDLPEKCFNAMEKRFSSEEKKNRFLREKDGEKKISFAEDTKLENGRTISVVAFNAPCLLCSDVQEFEYGNFLHGGKIGPNGIVSQVRGGVNLFYVLAKMIVDSYFALKDYDTSALEEEKKLKEIYDILLKELKKDKTGMVQKFHEFLSHFGGNISVDLVEKIMVSFMFSSKKAKTRSRISKITGWSAIASGIVGIATSAIAGTAFGVSAVSAAGAAGTALTAGAVATAVAAPIIIPIAVVAIPVAILSGVAAHNLKASDLKVKAAMELIRISNYTVLMSDLRNYMMSREDDVSSANVCLMAYDNLQDVEKAKTYKLVRHLADIVEDPKYRNLGAMCEFITVKGKDVDAYAPSFGTYRKNVFAYFKQIFIRMGCKQNIEDMTFIRDLLNGVPSPEKLLQIDEKRREVKIKRKGTDKLLIIHSWKEFLHACGIDDFDGSITDCFLNEEVDIPQVFDLTEDDLKEIGIKKMGPRRKILKFVGENEVVHS